MDERIARMHIATCKLMGVDFLPSTGPTTQTESTGPTTQTESSDQQQQLEELKQLHDTTCSHCTAGGFTNMVFGCGDANADLMFIGEAPGHEEDLKGIPFVGVAGQKLNQIILAMGIDREDVYIANVLKARPPNNRTPLSDEVAACGPFLKQQIDIINPQVIVTLGSPATKYLLETTRGITTLRGSWHRYNDIPVMPTYHPAYLLRNYTKETRQEVWSDMQKVVAKLQM